MRGSTRSWMVEAPIPIHAEVVMESGTFHA